MNRIGKITVRVEADVNPTEDPDKVRISILKVMGDLQLETVEEGGTYRLIGEGEGAESLAKFQELLRRERILDAARKVLFKGLHGDTVIFYLNRQVAYVGHISFSQNVGESPLGPIKVEVQCEEPRMVIEWLAPRTR